MLWLACGGLHSQCCSHPSRINTACPRTESLRPMINQSNFRQFHPFTPISPLTPPDTVGDIAYQSRGPIVPRNRQPTPLILGIIYESAETQFDFTGRRLAPPCMITLATSSGDFPGRWMRRSSCFRVGRGRIFFTCAIVSHTNGSGIWQGARRPPTFSSPDPTSWGFRCSGDLAVVSPDSLSHCGKGA